MNGLKSPALGPWLHAGMAALVAVAIPVFEYCMDYFGKHSSEPEWDWKGFMVGLAIAIMGWFLSKYRNAGAVTLDEASGAKVKGVVSQGGAMVVTTADQVVATDEVVLIPKPAG